MAGGKFSSGIIEYAGANTPGWISNLGITLAAGVFTITDAQGATLTPANPGWVTVPSTTAGQSVTLKMIAPNSFIDDAGSSNIIGELFGVTTSIAWADDMPFFIYVANRANSDIDGADGSSVFFISRDPRMNTTPSASGDIGDTAAVSTNKGQASIFILNNVTVGNYTSLPCQLVGAFRMQMSASDDWTVQAFGQRDGIGSGVVESNIASFYDFPLGQNGAASGTPFLDNGGTAPVFSTNNYRYTIGRDGWCDCVVRLNGDGGTDGAGAVTMLLAIPYVNESNFVYNAGVTRVETPAFDALCTFNIVASASNGALIKAFISGTSLENSVDSVNNNAFTNGARSITGSFRFKAF